MQVWLSISWNYSKAIHSNCYSMVIMAWENLSNFLELTWFRIVDRPQGLNEKHLLGYCCYRVCLEPQSLIFFDVGYIYFVFVFCDVSQLLIIKKKKKCYSHFKQALKIPPPPCFLQEKEKGKENKEESLLLLICFSETTITSSFKNIIIIN